MQIHLISCIGLHLYGGKKAILGFPHKDARDRPPGSFPHPQFHQTLGAEPREQPPEQCGYF